MLSSGRYLALATTGAPAADESRQGLLEHYLQVRATTEALAAPLSAEDQCLQSMPEASPTKWHLAHVTWFFETMVLAAFVRSYRPWDERYHFLFNSYYERLGPRQPRPRRGMITRPGLAEILRYRSGIDQAVAQLIMDGSEAIRAELATMITLGLHHEQQHQELILTDIKHALSCNPYDPVYRPAAVRSMPASRLSWCDFPGGEVQVGHTGPGFAFDNESPRHPVLLGAYQLASRLSSCGEYLAFMADDGYRRPEFWLFDGWNMAVEQGWQAPLYWRREDSGQWSQFTLHGRRPVDPAEPVCHVSLYEAAAFAAWAKARLPTEFEWEAAVAGHPISGHFADAALLHSQAAPTGPGLQQAYGDAWQWTRSAYDPYPGFRPLPGALGEYNGKFMVGQLVLRGGSCASPAGHLRASYRNFFAPGARWQFSGIRLARDP